MAKNSSHSLKVRFPLLPCQKHWECQKVPKKWHWAGASRTEDRSGIGIDLSRRFPQDFINHPLRRMGGRRPNARGRGGDPPPRGAEVPFLREGGEATLLREGRRRPSKGLSVSTPSSLFLSSLSLLSVSRNFSRNLSIS